jgi:DNA-binding NarL/FixJ family response regulator
MSSICSLDPISVSSQGSDAGGRQMTATTSAQNRLPEPADQDTPTAPIRVLVVERQAPVRLQVLRLLDDQPQLESVAVSAGREAVELARTRRVDVALLGDPSGAPGEPIVLTRDLRRLPAPPAVLLYAAEPAPALVAAAMVAGAAGLLTKAELADWLSSTIGKVADGGARWPRMSSPSLFNLSAQLPADHRSVFQMWTADVPDDAIARLHGLSQAELEEAREEILRALRRSPAFAEDPRDDGSWPLSWARSREMRGRRA